MPLVASQVIGLILMRYVLEVEPLASMPSDRSSRRTPRRSSATSPIRLSLTVAPTSR